MEFRSFQESTKICTKINCVDKYTTLLFAVKLMSMSILFDLFLYYSISKSVEITNNWNVIWNLVNLMITGIGTYMLISEAFTG